MTRNRRIVELYLRGWNTQEDIAENLDCDRTTITKVINDVKNTQMRKIHKEWNLSSKDKDYNKRKPFTKPDKQDIADEVGCSRRTVKRLIEKIGQKRKNSDLPENFEPKIYKVWNYSSCNNAVEWTGNIPQDIAEQVGCSIGYISNLFKNGQMFDFEQPNDTEPKTDALRRSYRRF